MSKLTDFFLGFKRRYDEQVIRNKNMDEFLKSAKDNFDKIGEMNTTVTNLDTKVANLETKVDNLQTDMTNMNGRLEVIGRGTKIELLETLYRWKKLLMERGWRTKEETKEIEELYDIYNKKLKGNGQGT
jgi:predicted RNase H-like nuclease (RuvC/YqgF family)